MHTAADMNRTRRTRAIVLLGLIAVALVGPVGAAQASGGQSSYHKPAGTDTGRKVG
jgi:hypothetical protein